MQDNGMVIVVDYDVHQKILSTIHEQAITIRNQQERIRKLENHIEELEAELEEGVNEVGLP